MASNGTEILQPKIAISRFTTETDLPDTSVPMSSVMLHKSKKSFGGRLRLEALLGGEDRGKSYIGSIVTICGWARTLRKPGKGFCFVEINDGSWAESLQVVVQGHMEGYDALASAVAGSSHKFVGEIVEKEGDQSKQAVELHVKDPEKHCLKVLGQVIETPQRRYPLAKARMPREHLRDVAHVRCRTRIISAVARMRHAMSLAIHEFFHQRGFLYVHTPIITATDCEGAGEMFQVSTLFPPPDKNWSIPTTKDGKIEYKKDFFKRPAFLTVSGQLAAENYACGLCDVYTFGPTFRAEMSHTSRHLAEFWMVEPEMAFADLCDNMNVAEALTKFCVRWALEQCREDLQFLEVAEIEQKVEGAKRVAEIEKKPFNKEDEMRTRDEAKKDLLIARLQKIVDEPFARISYTEAFDFLKEHAERFQEKPEQWGMDFASEHERFLAESVFKKPVIVYNYPKMIKAFYMRKNDGEPEDRQTVAAMDVLVPKIGEMVGGSQREERPEVLRERIKEMGLNVEDYSVYMDLRNFGSVVHSGFGLGFERLVMLVTGIDNIRDVIPFPRYPGNAEG